MAWERAKGELRSILATYWGGFGKSGHEEYDSISDVIKEFIEKMDDELEGA